MLTTHRRLRAAGLALALLAPAVLAATAPGASALAATPDPVVCSQGAQLAPDLHIPTTPVVSCTLTAPTSGNLVIVGSAGFLPGSSGSTSARLSLGVDGTEVPRTFQYASALTNGNDGADANSGPVTMTHVAAGAHTVQLNVSKQEENPVTVTRSHVWALFVPDGSPYQACATAPGAFTGSGAAGTNDQAVTSCTLTTTTTSTVVVLASGSYVEFDGDYEARTGLGIDGPADNTTTRWANAYAAGASMAPMATELVKEVPAGAHTITLLSARASGSGSLRLFSPTLVALAVPTGSAGIQVCSATSSSWQSNTSSATNVTSCSLAPATSGDLLAIGSGSAGKQTGAYEGAFGMSLDGGGTPLGASRWLDIANDSGDGQDAVQVTSAAFAVQPGAHTLAHTGAMTSGTGPARLFRASLVGLFVPTAAPWTPPTTPPTTTPTTTAHTTTPTTTTPTPVPIPSPTPTPAPTPEAQLVGSKVKVAATVRLAKGATGCPAKATVTVRKGRTTLATARLRAKAVGKSSCRVSGKLTLPAKPSASARLKVAITGAGLRARTVPVARD